MKKLLGLLSASFLLCSSLLAMAAPLAVVNSHSCAKLRGTEDAFILVLNSGENLHESLNRCAKDAKLKGAAVSGLGQVEKPVLAYFTSDPKAKPRLTSFKGFYELASLTGNITNNANTYYTHLHAVLANPQFQGLAGHVNEATVGLTVELTLIPLTAALERTVDAKTGFGPIVH
jgi:predicted DNA-binding protein with PD1-like motif